jgi:repressor LexA
MDQNWRANRTGTLRARPLNRGDQPREPSHEPQNGVAARATTESPPATSGRSAPLPEPQSPRNGRQEPPTSTPDPPHEPPSLPSVGATIRARREALGLTLEALSDAARCAKSYLSEVERGRRPAPGEALLARLEHALALTPGALIERGRWEHAPPGLRRQLARLASERRAASRLAELVSAGSRGSGLETDTALGATLDDAWRSGELARLVQRLAPEPAHADPGAAHPADHFLSHEVPLINSVAAGFPTEFTDLGYPARVADEYVRCAPLDDPDAFAARVVGDSMSPQYVEGDIVVFSPARPIRSGMDCFARLEPDNDTTFKRVYFQTTDDGRELIRLQPLNAAYPARVLDREGVAGLYAAVSVTREL